MKKIIKELKHRLSGLDSYLNDKEISLINMMINEINVGLAAEKEAKILLEKIPSGKYDSDRKKYKKMLLFKRKTKCTY